jgi:hypothetical protein
MSHWIVFHIVLPDRRPPAPKLRRELINALGRTTSQSPLYPRSRIWAIIGFMYHSQVRELMRRVRRTFGFRCGESRSRLVWSAALNAVPQRLAFRRRAATGGDPHDGHFATQCLGQSPFIPGVLMSETIKMSYTSSQACRTAASAVSSDGLPLNTIRPWPIT